MSRPAESRAHAARATTPALEPTAHGAWSRWATPLAVLALVALAFAPSLRASLVNWDDYENLVDNQRFRGFSREHLGWMFTTNWMGPYQPLSWLSLAIDHALWGLGPAPGCVGAHGFHATNVLLHALTALAFYFVALRLFRHPFAAGLAALVFAIHPLRAESVAWVTERRDVLCGLFYVLAVLAYLRWVRRAGVVVVRPKVASIAVVLALLALALFLATLDLSSKRALQLGALGPAGLALAFVCVATSGALLVRAVRFDGERASIGGYLAVLALFVLALLSKGLALTLPLVLIALDFGVLGRGRALCAREGGDVPREPSAWRSTFHLALEKLPFFVLALVCARLAMWGQAAQPGTLVPWDRHTLSERVAQAFYGLAFYPAKTLAPVSLSPIYDLPETLSFDEPRFLYAMLAVVAATVACLYLRRRIPALLAAWLAFAVSVAPVLGFSQAGPQIAADRYTYLSCMSFALLAGGAFLVLWNTRPASHLALGAIAFALVASLAALTFGQTRIWHDSDALWSHAIEVEPLTPMTHLNLGHVRIEQAGRAANETEQRARLAEAMAFFERGWSFRPHPLLLAGEALVHQRLWELDPPASADHAALCLELAQKARAMAVERGELTPEYDFNLGCALFNLGRIDEALPPLESFASAKPDNFLGRFNLGFALLRAQRYADALPHLERAVELNPEHVNAWGNLGLAYEGLGDKARAIETYRRVLALAPSHPTATKKLLALTGGS